MPEFHSRHTPRTKISSILSIVLMVGSLLMGAMEVSAESAKLSWNPNPEADIAGYEVHYGTSSSQLDKKLNVGKTTTATVSDLQVATTYHFAVLAYNLAGLKSPLSDQVSFTTRAAPAAGLPALQVKDDTGASFDMGSILDLGVVNLGALSETRSFTVTNLGGTTLNGLTMALSGDMDKVYNLSGNFPSGRMLELNGSFESGLASWTATGNVKDIQHQVVTNGLRAVVFGAGNNANTGVLRRSFPTIPGVTYTLSYDVGVYSFNTNEQRLRTSVSGTGSLITATAILKGGGGGGTIWSPRSFNFVANSETTTVAFSDISTTSASIDLLLDHVRVMVPSAVSGGTVISSLAPGMSASFSIAFQPGSAGSREALLRLTSEPEGKVHFEMTATASGNVFFEPWLSSKGVTGGPSENPDGDALNNLQEFAFGTDPAAANGNPAVETGGKVISRGVPVPRISTSPSFEFRGQFGRRKNHDAAGLIYRPQFSADLITWVDAVTTPVIHADDGEIEIVSVASPASIGGQVPRFFRVGVEQKQPVSLPAWLVQNGASGGTNGNPDGDALDNFFEFAFGTDPAVAQTKSAAEVNGLLLSRGAPAVRVLGSPGAPGFEFSGLFCRRKDREFHGLIYTPQFSADLVTWVDATGMPEVRADDGEIEVVSVFPPASVGGKTPRFFRVGLSQTSPETLGKPMIQMMRSATEDPDGNPDGDDFNNLLEFAFGTDPTIPQSSRIEESNGWLVSRGAPSARVTNIPEFEFRGLFGRRKDHSSHGLIYKPQFSADLTNWMDADDSPTVLADDGEIEVVSVRAPASAKGDAVRFFRVAVSRIP